MFKNVIDYFYRLENRLLTCKLIVDCTDKIHAFILITSHSLCPFHLSRTVFFHKKYNSYKMNRSPLMQRPLTWVPQKVPTVAKCLSKTTNIIGCYKMAADKIFFQQSLLVPGEVNKFLHFLDHFTPYNLSITDILLCYAFLFEECKTR